MCKIEFKPNDPAPSDAEKTVYNVFVDGDFAGYVYKNWMEYWTYYVDGQSMTGGYVDRCDLFNLIKKDPCLQA